MGANPRRARRYTEHLHSPLPAVKIACPKCAWEPTASARWSCACGHAWNTFETGGQCPKCKTVWRDTQCLACQKWSKHHDWYRDLPSVDALLEEVRDAA